MYTFSREQFQGGIILETQKSLRGTKKDSQLPKKTYVRTFVQYGNSYFSLSLKVDRG